MEGYLLALTKDRDAQLWFCVLELGVLRCFVKPNGALVEAIPLTRHSVRVVVHADGVCPNEFAVCAVAVQFDETRAKLRLQRDQERVVRFAAPTPDRMRKWGRAIHNWKRYAFVEPTPTNSSSTTTTPTTDTATKATRRAALREEAQTLISFVTSFDLRLKVTVPLKPTTTKYKTHAVDCRASMVASTNTNNSSTKADKTRHERLSLPTASGRTSLAAWIPVRVPSLRRMWSSSPPQT